MNDYEILRKRVFGNISERNLCVVRQRTRIGVNGDHYLWRIQAKNVKIGKAPVLFNCTTQSEAEEYIFLKIIDYILSNENTIIGSVPNNLLVAANQETLFFLIANINNSFSVKVYKNSQVLETFNMNEIRALLKNILK